MPDDQQRESPLAEGTFFILRRSNECHGPFRSYAEAAEAGRTRFGDDKFGVFQRSQADVTVDPHNIEPTDDLEPPPTVEQHPAA